ncbi:MAG: hypothetical protein GT598_15600 [Bacteroidales bacterium]|nr:hypothetical protein [Bacteroidales bacterium]
MANIVYRWKKPELTVTLTEGGTLLPNTTYYYFGFFKDLSNTTWVYHMSHSPMSDVSTFTTTSTHKSVSVTWQTSGEIESFSDGGDGTTIVTSHLHCLTTGNKIIITSSNYSGTYTITWLGAHTFRINKAFVGDETGSWICKIFPNRAQTIQMWCDTTNPFNSEGVFVGAINKMSHGPYVSAYNTNPFNITAPYLVTASPTYCTWTGYIFPYPQYNNLTRNIGKPSIIIDEGTTSIATINNLIKEYEIDEYNIITNNLIKLTAHVKITTPNVLTLTSYTIIQECCTFQWEAMTLSYGVGISNKGRQRAIMKYNVSNSVVFSDCAVDGIPKPIVGTTNSFYMDLNFSYSTFYLEEYNLYNSKLTWTSPNGYLKNSNIYDFYLYLVYYYDNIGVQPRTLQNIYIRYRSYDIMVYSYSADERQCYYENVDTSRANNRKVITYAGTLANLEQTSFYFMRKFTTQIVDTNNIPIVGASINIKDDKNQSYNLTSDENGYVVIDVIEQTHVYNNLNTYYENFELTISKNGYVTQKQYYAYGKLMSDALNNNKIWLNTTPLPVYYQDNLIGETNEQELIAELSAENFKGKVNNDVLSGKIT